MNLLLEDNELIIVHCTVHNEIIIVQYVHNEIIIVQYTKNDYFTVHNQLSIVQYTMNLLLSSPQLTNNYCTVHTERIVQSSISCTQLMCYLERSFLNEVGRTKEITKPPKLNIES